MEDKLFYQEDEELCTIEYDDEVECSENCHYINELEEQTFNLEEEIKRLNHVNLIRDGLYKKALNTYGIQAQIGMVFEEMSELQKELCKYLRGKAPVEQQVRIAEEIADVEIMLDQMKIYFKNHEAVEKYKKYKIKRLGQNLLKGDI